LLEHLPHDPSSATSLFASTTSPPYERQFLSVFCDASSPSLLFERDDAPCTILRYVDREVTAEALQATNNEI
jgi:hypothetical protein